MLVKQKKVLFQVRSGPIPSSVMVQGKKTCVAGTASSPTSSSAFPATSLEFTILPEIFVYGTIV